MKLPQKQMELLELAAKRTITMDTARMVFSDMKYAKDVLKRLTLLNYLKCAYGQYDITNKGIKKLEMK